MPTFQLVDMDTIALNIGRKQMQIESLQQEYANLLQVFSDVCSGSIQKERVKIDLVARSWVIEPVPEKAVEPTA